MPTIPQSQYPDGLSLLQYFPNELPDRKKKQGIFSRLVEVWKMKVGKKGRKGRKGEGKKGKRVKVNMRTTEEAMRREFHR